MYELCPYFTNDGTVGLFSKTDDDIYHSTYGALSESWQKFIIPSRLETYLKNHSEVKILDICYGIGYNTKTALNVFINNSLNSKKHFRKNNKSEKNKYFSKNLAEKFSHESLNIASIDTDNIQKDSIEYYKENNFSEADYSTLLSICNSAIDSNNIIDKNIAKNDGIDLVQDLKNKLIQDFNGMFEHELDLNTNTTCNKILIDAVDSDKTLINLSPFITEGIKSYIMLRKYIIKKYFEDNNKKNKLLQIINIRKNKLKLPSKKFRLKKEVSIILFEKLIEQNKNFLEDPILQIILTQKKYAPFLGKFMINLSKFSLKRGCKDNKKGNKLAFLHNIYYKYISRSYKNAQKVLKNNQVDINFHKNDARCFIKETSNKYNFIFLDAFTPAKCPSLWTVQFFKELYSKLEDDGMILTYSNSAAIRNAFLQNGFVVGKTYDSKMKKFVGTVATKNINLIEHKLDERDLDLINSRAGICFKDEELKLDNASIIKNRELEVENSELISSSKVLKGYKNDNAKSL